MQSQQFLPDITIVPEGRVSVLDGNFLTRPGVTDDQFLPRMNTMDMKPGVHTDGRASILDRLSTRDMRSRASINTRMTTETTRDLKSRASSRRQNSGYYRKVLLYKIV